MVDSQSTRPRFFLQTVGCQMNVLDSELGAARRSEAGYRRVDRPDRADLVLLNTCSVRQHAEDKIYSALGRLKPWKEQSPGRIIGVLGCMAEKDGRQILRRAPHVDLVVGPGRLAHLPVLLQAAADRRGPHVEQGFDSTDGLIQRQTPFVVGARPSLHQAMVRVVAGCNMACAYCIVPKVRGPEQSRPAVEILDEVRRLADSGCLEVALLGQTVNSYKDAAGGKTLRLADLLYLLHDVGGIRRLKFVTNHPRHMSDDLLTAMRDLPKVSPYLHAPAQSGSNAVLRRMRRGYTVEYYREMFQRIRQTVPQAAVTSDFIVGFPGETDDDFQQTYELVREARFKNSFIFKYSARPGTFAADHFADDVPEAVKRRRNNDLLALQDAISLEDNRSFVGRSVEVLVEGVSKVGRKKPPDGATAQLIGRTACDRIVVFDGPEPLTGQLLSVVVEKADAFTLFGKLSAGSDLRAIR